ncbi:MAG: ATP-dependent zinc metalloprotease FtsH [Brevinematales bacterium]|nr:ATP-dependent zinc metalloprotease FtsH [Brevinematales bacterium]
MANKQKNGDFLSHNDNSAPYVFILIIIVVSVIAFLFFSSKPKEIMLSYSKFISYIENDSLSQVVIEGQMIRGKFKAPINNYTYFRTYLPLEDKDLLPLLKQHNVEVIGEKLKDNFLFNTILGYVIMFLLILGFWFLIRGAQGGDPGKAMSFAKTKARLYKDTNNKVKFKDVAGCEEAKEDLKEIVEFLKNPSKFTGIGARIPKGVLLVGSPGTGKTLLAKAVAGEAGVPFFSVSGSEFVEMFVGVGAARVRDLFEQGRKNAPCIIFIDELDAVGRSRGTGLGGSHDEREQTLNQILVEMDGFDSSEALIIIAATNRPDVLDPALLRPGRFDRQVVVDRPDVKAREEILKIHVKKVPLDENVDLSVIARGTPGFTGADIENLVNEAALHAARENKKTVSMDDFEFAKDKVMMGAERRSAVLSEEEKLITAYHEAGHAIVGHLLPLVDPIHKVTIIPRGRALGVTATLPLDEKRNYSKETLMQELIVLLAGRAAEEVKFGKKWISTGASNDIERATKIANSMVCEWGMSDKLGPVTYGEKEGPVFLGKDLVTKKNFSEKIHEIIDNEVKSIVTTAYETSKKIIEDNIKKLDELSNKLLEKEVLNSTEIEEIIGPSEKKRYPILETIGYKKKKSRIKNETN